MQTAINIDNIPAVLRTAIDEYNKVGYTLMPSMLTPQEIELAVKELNYQTLGRGVDLTEPSTWQNVADLHDWKQGWAKWLFCSGIQVKHYWATLKFWQIFANTHPLLYMFVASLNNNFALMCNMYEAKIHLPNTGGAFVHNNLNWFHYYQAYMEGKQVDAMQSPQMVMFLSDTVPGKYDFLISNALYPHDNWVKTIKVNKVTCYYL